MSNRETISLWMFIGFVVGVLFAYFIVAYDMFHEYKISAEDYMACDKICEPNKGVRVIDGFGVCHCHNGMEIRLDRIGG